MARKATAVCKLNAIAALFRVSDAPREHTTILPLHPDLIDQLLNVVDNHDSGGTERLTCMKKLDLIVHNLLTL
jgi:hypothetical protein